MSVQSLIMAGAVLLALPGTSSAGEIIDRVLAVAGGQIITLSDARAAVRLALVPPEASGDPVAAALQRLIDRRLMLAEIERYAPAEPSAAAVDVGVAAIREGFGDALAFEVALNQTAMSHEELRRYVRDSIRIDAYLKQRFGSMVQPSDDELARYYREHSGAFTVGGVLVPFDAVREEVRARMVEERQADLVEEWIEGLRRRGNVVVLYLPGRQDPE